MALRMRNRVNSAQQKIWSPLIRCASRGEEIFRFKLTVHLLSRQLRREGALRRDQADQRSLVQRRRLTFFLAVAMATLGCLGQSVRAQTPTPTPTVTVTPTAT